MQKSCSFVEYFFLNSTHGISKISTIRMCRFHANLSILHGNYLEENTSIFGELNAFRKKTTTLKSEVAAVTIAIDRSKTNFFVLFDMSDA